MTTIQEEKQTIYEYFAQADREFEGGNKDECAILLYKAVESAMTLVAKSWQQPCESEDDIANFAYFLDERLEAPRWHVINYMSALAMFHNAQYHFLDPDEMLGSKKYLPGFVERLMSYLEEEV